MTARALITAFFLLACNAAIAAAFNFALIGDTPYSPDEEASFTAMLREIDLQDVAFVVHVGDFKNGSTSCGDAVFAQRKEMFAASRHALIYVPGDNDWTDCWRLFAGQYNPLERLARLRELFFSRPLSLGMHPLALTRQSDAAAAPRYPEHTRWMHANVVFASFNLPGGDNNLTRMPQEHAQRDAAARDWLKQAFAAARRGKSLGLVVLIHANPFRMSLHPRRGFVDFMELLAAETVKFDGQVLLVHGDTHFYRVDQPLRHPASRETLRNLTRVEVFGSPRVDWVRVRVLDGNGGIRFDIRPGR